MGTYKVFDNTLDGTGPALLANNAAFIANMPRSKILNKRPREHGFLGPQGAPRGLLRHYILRRIAEKPAHGYDILQEIASKTEGSWRPGAGSVYPILKELLTDGYIKTEPQKRGGTSQRIYHITSEGTRLVQQSSDMVLKAGQNWGAMKRLFIELVEPKQLPSLFTHMASGQFGFLREALELKKDKIPHNELGFMLKEYALNLQRQLDWTNRTIKQL